MEKIHELNKTGVKFDWDEPHKKEFKEMKEHLNKVCKIHAYDFSLPMEMFCDAAKTGGLGYILTQKKPEGEYNIIYAGSTGLTELQKRTWSMGELELGAVVFGLQNLRYFTYDSPHITIHTDNSPLHTCIKCFSCS